MSSAKFEGGKYHTATEAKSHMRHDDITPEARKIAAKNNPHIDVTKSNLNKSLLGLTYEQMCQKYDNRIAMLDKTTNKNKRKDRVTLQNIEVPVPTNLDRKKYNKWFIRVAEIMCDLYGSENLIDGQIHYDEEHEYIDAETHEKRMSRVHMHASIVPEIKGQLNCKKMSGRANMKKLNNEIEKMTQNEFGCSFMTGEKKKSKQTVDELKNASERLMAEHKNQKLQADNLKLQHENATLKISLKQKQKEADKTKSQLEAQIAEFKRYRDLELHRLNVDRQHSEELKQMANNKLQTVKALYIKLLALHNKLIQFDDIYLEYAGDFGEQIGNLKREIDSISL